MRVPLALQREELESSVFLGLGRALEHLVPERHPRVPAQHAARTVEPLRADPQVDGTARRIHEAIQRECSHVAAVSPSQPRKPQPRRPKPDDSVAALPRVVCAWSRGQGQVREILAKVTSLDLAGQSHNEPPDTQEKREISRFADRRSKSNRRTPRRPPRRETSCWVGAHAPPSVSRCLPPLVPSSPPGAAW
jgi:hypothetical protein